MIASKRAAQILRVNHAGEWGAVHIYKGQLAVLRHKSQLAPDIEHMSAQEQEHFTRFQELLNAQKVRPTYFLPLWQALGYAAGVGSALLGDKAAMALTVAVEEVIDGHYQKQLKEIPDVPNYEKLRGLIDHCHQEELEHRDTGLGHQAETLPAYKVFNGLVKKATKTAIWLSERL